jgi:hypothetical protein
MEDTMLIVFWNLLLRSSRQFPEVQALKYAHPRSGRITYRGKKWESVSLVPKEKEKVEKIEGRP